MRLHAAAALALAVTCADAAGITEVTTRTFEAETSKGDPLLLVFYARGVDIVDAWNRRCTSSPRPVETPTRSRRLMGLHIAC